MVSIDPKVAQPLHNRWFERNESMMKHDRLYFTYSTETCTSKKHGSRDSWITRTLWTLWLFYTFGISCTLLYTTNSWIFCCFLIFDTYNTRHRRTKGCRWSNSVGLDIYIINQHRSTTYNLWMFITWSLVFYLRFYFWY